MKDNGELDSIDEALLDELQKDARQTNKALAQKVGVAPSTCLERIRELRARGVIKGFRADVDPAAVGPWRRSSRSSSGPHSPRPPSGSCATPPSCRRRSA